ncbi:hypothetical protein DPMN_172673 [Dreissena polymorpha]|uniref:Uncharacterized protein n=1 Tax=Dreissena polymorpha TaxID=45954 RepID=A0A9D4E221_DREPO|nr:hypothetical protein DPMN_172673 [Dreissena polymorpha]
MALYVSRFLSFQTFVGTGGGTQVIPELHNHVKTFVSDLSQRDRGILKSSLAKQDYPTGGLSVNLLDQKPIKLVPKGSHVDSVDEKHDWYYVDNIHLTGKLTLHLLELL